MIAKKLHKSVDGRGLGTNIRHPTSKAVETHCCREAITSCAPRSGTICYRRRRGVRGGGELSWPGVRLDATLWALWLAELCIRMRCSRLGLGRHRTWYRSTYVFTRRFVLVRGGSCPGCFVRVFFVRKVLFGVVFVRPPSVKIHPLQQKAKHHFQF